MKLHCLSHHRRVVVLANGTAVHRNGEGERCTGELQIGIWRLGISNPGKRIHERPASARRPGWAVRRGIENG